MNELVLDAEDHPSEICAGAALVVHDAAGPAVLVIRTRSDGWELPKGGIEWDELPEEAALRELREESGVAGELGVSADLGRLQYSLGAGSERRLLSNRGQEACDGPVEEHVGWLGRLVPKLHRDRVALARPDRCPSSDSAKRCLGLVATISSSSARGTGRPCRAHASSSTSMATQPFAWSAIPAAAGSCLST